MLYLQLSWPQLWCMEWWSKRSLKYRRRIRRDFSCCSSRIADYGTNRICFRIFRRWENCKDIGIYCYAPEWQTTVYYLRNFNLYLLHYVPDYESCCNYFIQGHKNIWNMDSDMGNEFSNGNLLSDVLLWSACKTNF